MRIREISDTIVDEAAIRDFSVLIDSSYNFYPFYYSTGSVSYVGEFSYKEHTYSLMYKIIPLKTSLFYHSLFTGLYDFGQDQTFDGRCPKSKAGVDTFVKLNDGADNNTYLLSSSPMHRYNTLIPGDPEQKFHKFGGYCFYVKE